MSVTSDVAFRIKATDQGAERAFSTVVSAQEKLRESTKRISNETGEQTRSVSTLTSGWGALLGKLSLLAGAAQVIRTITEGVNEQARALESIGQAAKTDSERLNSFRSIQAPGPAGKAFFVDALKMAANLGIAAPNAAETIEPIQAAINQGDVTMTPEEREKTLGASEAALRGQVLGIPSDVSGLIEVQGVTRGMQAGELTAMTLQAAAMSAFNQRDFGKALPQMQFWKDIEDAMSAGIVISQQITDPGEFGTMVKSAGRLLGPSGDTETLIEMLGLQGKSPIEKLQGFRAFAVSQGLPTEGAKSQAEFAAMSPEERATYRQQGQDAIDTWSRSMGMYGVDIRVAQAAGALVRSMEQFEDLSATFKSVRGMGEPEEAGVRSAYTERVIGDMWDRVMSLPGASRDLIVNRAQATGRLDNIVGPLSDEAEDQQMISYAEGLRRRRGGFSTGYDPTTSARNFSEPTGFISKWVERAGRRHRELQGMDTAAPATFLEQEIGGVLGNIEGGTPSGTTAELGAWLSALTRALESNTAATEASTASETAGPGAAAVSASMGDPSAQISRNRAKNKRNLDAGL